MIADGPYLNALINSYCICILNKGIGGVSKGVNRFQ